MEPMILACVSGVAALLGVCAYVASNRRVRNGK
jgi:hypothetical protein